MTIEFDSSSGFFESLYIIDMQYLSSSFVTEHTSLEMNNEDLTFQDGFMRQRLYNSLHLPSINYLSN